MTTYYVAGPMLGTGSTKMDKTSEVTTVWQTKTDKSPSRTQYVKDCDMVGIGVGGGGLEGP